MAHDGYAAGRSGTTWNRRARAETRAQSLCREPRGLDLLELSLDRLVLGRRLALLGRGTAVGAGPVRGSVAGLPRRRRGGLVGGRRDPLERLGQRLHPGLDDVHVRALESLAQRLDLVLDLGLVLG